MLSSLLRPRKGRRRIPEHSPFSSQIDRSSPTLTRAARGTRHATADFTETENDEENTEDEQEGDLDDLEDDGEDDEEGEDGEEDIPLLPIFSAAHLDSIPVYNLTHAIRLIVLPRTETTLTWDQLRSPQVSQFLVKPMQQQIRTSHFSRATLYALMANCLQFTKEGERNAGLAGNSRTRALVCELLAIKLLKEYNTRELIDALSYDFFPLQGLPAPDSGNATPGSGWEKNRPKPAAARISTLEVAIRASAKHFIAHPLVVQQLEAIWAGSIVFHSAADNLHRTHLQMMSQTQTIKKTSGSSQHLLVPGQNPGYGTSSTQLSPDKQQPNQNAQNAVQFMTRRTVTLYDPRDASLFKLSRLRVPRYRQFFSTLSFAVLLGLFLAVLIERSIEITTLEIIFWFWSAGYMLDELVGFSEQGFQLYIMSFWNAFDLGILFLLIIFYSMRLYGIFLVDVGRHDWNSMAYDVLATNAVLLFPRLFSVLDHYRYFSQLLIAFRLMAIDLVAVFVLILIACSGFFVAFTLSFGKNEYDAAGVAYKIFQILMGFTPAAWEAWGTYNFLGKALLVLFLFICHFLVVTILITVLTNSFMAIVSNANEEHQFVFAVNAISMVKNDALFSYVAPSNIFAWILTPLRFGLTFRSFIKVNRTFIKVTHFPLLFSIYAYERIFLARSVFEPTDLVENAGRGRKRLVSFRDPSLYSPGVRMRQESVAGFQKDKALDEVFRLAPRSDTIRSNRKSLERRQTNNVVHNWMDTHEEVASPPPEDSRSTVDRLEKRKQARRATLLRRRALSREISGTRSVASDPAEFMSSAAFNDFGASPTTGPPQDISGQTDADGDDELLSNDEDEAMTLDKRSRMSQSHAAGSDKGNEEGDYFRSSLTARLGAQNLSSSVTSSKQQRFAPHPVISRPPHFGKKAHDRNMSSSTILYNPLASLQNSSSASPPKSRPTTSIRRPGTGTHTPAASGHRSPKKSIYTTAATVSRPRPIMPSRQQFQSVPNFKNLDMDSRAQGNERQRVRHRRSSLDMGMSELDVGENHMLGAVPSSFATQMAMATGMAKRERVEDTEGMMGRLMLARMKTLEEGFQEVVREFRGVSRANTTKTNSPVETAGSEQAAGPEKRRRKKGKERERPISRSSLKDFVGRPGPSKGKGKGKDNLEAEKTWAPEDEVIEHYLAKGNSL
ncbi:integral membrane channel protein [Phlyctema vagabunda]|uniref:Integral membrane channel protein n=1 Tax=Phlyctema vagabunda TaxID=108571 RepID=A0ABR4P9U1_9HELO